MTYAIIKPDHLGDLILSSAAIHAITQTHRDTVLFVASKNLALARYLFPEIEIRAIDFAHLSKTGGGDRIPDLTGFETVAFLRNDAVMTENWAALRTRGFLLPHDTHLLHQSMIDYTVASLLAGPYDIDAAFYGDRAERVFAKAVAAPGHVGLSIGSGFHANTWPITRWLEAARSLLPQVETLTILCGPAERGKAEFILDRLGRPKAADLVCGGDDIAAFMRRVDDLDLVIASDGGTAHLCSLVTPIVSIFGPSPFRRYAPYGRLNRLLTRQLPCSPCCQYTTDLVNGCLTTECMVGITARHLERALTLPLRPDTPARRLPPEEGVHLFVGVSHADQKNRLANYQREAWSTAAEHPSLINFQPLESSELLTDMQASRLALINAVDRLKRTPAERYPIAVRRVAAHFARLRQANIAARESMI